MVQWIRRRAKHKMQLIQCGMDAGPADTDCCSSALLRNAPQCLRNVSVAHRQSMSWSHL